MLFAQLFLLGVWGNLAGSGRWGRKGFSFEKPTIHLRIYVQKNIYNTKTKETILYTVDKKNKW